MLLVFCNFKIIWSLNDLIIGRHGRDKQFYKALQLLLEFFLSNSVLYLVHLNTCVLMCTKNQPSIAFSKVIWNFYSHTNYHTFLFGTQKRFCQLPNILFLAIDRQQKSIIMIFYISTNVPNKDAKCWAGDKCQNVITYGNFVDTKRITQNANLN